MSRLFLEIPGQPIPKARARILKSGFAYDPQNRDKESVRTILMFKKGTKSIPDAPLRVALDFYLAKPKTTKHKLLPTCKPDLYNLVKFYLDAMNGVVYHDDSWVVEVRAKKQWADGEPATLISIDWND